MIKEFTNAARSPPLSATNSRLQNNAQNNADVLLKETNAIN